MTETLCLIVITTLLNMCCFYFGAKIGQKVIKGEELKLPNPVRTVQDFNTRREIRKELDKDKIINENIDNYNGTSLGQQDIPR